MLTIRESAEMERALSGPLDTTLKAMLLSRLRSLSEYSDFNLSELVHFIIVEPGDTIAIVEYELGFSPFVNFVDGERYPSPAFTPSWEWLTEKGRWIDTMWALSDSGFGIVLLVPDYEGIEPNLLAMLKTYIA
jgi:hypothetical protein